jgi:FlaA1/EpsC-like NDP-sugar epimerase
LILYHLLQPLADWLQTMPARHKRIILACVDAGIGAAVVMVVFGFNLAFVLVLGLIAGVASVAVGLDRIKLNAFLHGGIHRSLALSAVVSLAAMASLALAQGTIAVDVGLLALPMTFAGIVLSRATMLRTMLAILEYRQGPIRVLIYGAGQTGQQLSAALHQHETILVVGFLDDDPSLQRSLVSGLRVYSPGAITALALRHRIDRVLLAMPSLPAAKQMRLSRQLHALGLDVHALPSFAQLVGTEAICDQLAPLSPDDVLGRTELAWDLDRHADAYRDRTVMVTGAGGSVGAELCRQLLALGPRRLVLFERCELALYTVHRDLMALSLACTVDVCPVLGSVGDARGVGDALTTHGVDIVIHAAAYKHVPLVEANALAGLRNNVIGTEVLAEAAMAAGIKRFILISTDKAVRPTSVMGASKRLAELVVQDMARRPGKTVFSIVRFGNVLGSSGSVIPLFRDQIAAGGPVTLTHDDVTRYFMSLAEAAQLVLLAGALDTQEGGGPSGIFVLDMGKPIRIRDLAMQMIAAAGLSLRDEAHPDGDIAISIVGLRPGEKLHEDLLVTPGMMTTPHPKILRAVEPQIPTNEVLGVLEALRAAIDAGNADLARMVVDLAAGPRETRQNITLLPIKARA